jgi:hypothetical protein
VRVHNVTKPPPPPNYSTRAPTPLTHVVWAERRAMSRVVVVLVRHVGRCAGHGLRPRREQAGDRAVGRAVPMWVACGLRCRAVRCVRVCVRTCVCTRVHAVGTTRRRADLATLEHDQELSHLSRRLQRLIRAGHVWLCAPAQRAMQRRRRNANGTELPTQRSSDPPCPLTGCCRLISSH